MSDTPWSHEHVERVRFGDLDAMRHLNNVVFLRYFESARIAFLRSLVPEHDPVHPEASGGGLIFAECQIAYRAPGTYDEVVRVGVRPADLRRSSFRIEFEMRSDTNGGRLMADGYGVLVGYDYASGRATPLQDALRERLEALL